MRKIEPKMIAYIDSLLASDPIAKEALSLADPRLLFGRVADICVGIREVGGNNKGPLVELIQSTIGGANREAWCMSFIQTCLAYVEHVMGVVSPIAASEHCLTVWNKTPKKQRVKIIPGQSAIIIWQHGESQNGHTGVMREWREEYMYCVEGNTESGLSNNGSIERDGGGVYLTKRDSEKNGDMRVVGFLKPF